MKILILFISLWLSAALDAPQIRQDAVLVSNTIADIKCLHQQYKKAFPRGYLSTGMVDPSFAHNLQLLRVENLLWWPYMQPCFRCGNPAGQAQALINATGTFKIHAIIIVVNQSAGWSTSDLTLNQKFLLDLVS